MKISKNAVVTIEYRMVDQRGELIDSSDGGESLSFIQGREEVLPAIEKAVEGRQAGERVTLTPNPEDCFGVRDESKLAIIPREQFRHSDQLKSGMQFYTRKNGYDLPVTVTAIDNHQITVDGNHPLAGEPINIDLVIVDVRRAIDTEIESGEIQRDEALFMM